MKELLWNNLEGTRSRRPSAHFSFSGCARPSFNKQALETQESAAGHLERTSTNLAKNMFTENKFILKKEDTNM
jgi:hypothetical protein